MPIEIKSVNNDAQLKQIYRLVLANIDKSLYRNRKAVITPMKSARFALEKILKKHLGVPRGVKPNVGKASGVLSGGLRVVQNREAETASSTFTKSLAPDTIRITVPYELDLKTKDVEYGYPIGDEEGYEWGAGSKLIANWIAKKGYSNFYYKNSKGETKTVSSKKEALLAAKVIVAKKWGKKNIVLPKWYEITEKDDLSEVEAIIKRVGNFYMGVVGKELTRQTT